MVNMTSVDGNLPPRMSPALCWIEGRGEHRRIGKVLLEKRTDGKLYANGVEVIRYLLPYQRSRKTIRGHELRKRLKSKQVLNACILDTLLKYPELIPEDWKKGRTYFWGTIFQGPRRLLCVEYLYWDGQKWCWSFSWLKELIGREYAACLADLPQAA